jgi:membrane protein DedA with SNARE-associated domain
VSSDLIHFITQYGYTAIFGLIFLQEIGIPNPVSNEFVLLFAGYLAYTGALSLPWVILTAVAADFIGTTVLYIIFYLFGHLLLEKKPRWLPIKKETIERLQRIISRRDKWGIYLGRLVPYVRGYTSIAAGLLQISAKNYLLMVLLSAFTWSGGYVIAGRAIGPHWEDAISAVGGIRNAMFVVLGIFLVFLAVKHLHRHLKRKRAQS